MQFKAMIQSEFKLIEGMGYILASFLTSLMGVLEVFNLIIACLSGITFLAIGVYTLSEKVKTHGKLFRKNNKDES